MKLISIVVPCYNEEETVEIFYNETEKINHKLQDYQFEYIFVNDGSKDRTLNRLRLLSQNKVVHYISFSRNFGKEAALYAGLKEAKGDYVTVMDADLQDPPELLIEMVQILEHGEYDCVGTRRSTRKGEPLIRSWFARKFYQLVNRIGEVEMVQIVEHGE